MSKQAYRTFSRKDFIEELQVRNRRVRDLKSTLLNLVSAVECLDFSFGRSQQENIHATLNEAVEEAKGALK